MNESIPSLPAVLTFAATDPTSGAGLQADLLALASMGCYPLSVVTALTVQDTAGVESFLAIDPDWVADQARCILEDMPVAAFKVGMLGSTEIVTIVAEVVSDYPDIPLVGAAYRHEFDPRLSYVIGFPLTSCPVTRTKWARSVGK